MPEANSFENLTQSGLFKATSKDDKNVSMSIDVWGGNTSLVVFTGAGGKPWKLGLGPKVQANLIILIKKLMSNPIPSREPMFINEWVEENGKRRMNQKGCVGFGIDENLTFYIDIAANDLSGNTRYMFPIRNDGRYDFSNTTMSEKDMLMSTLQTLLTLLTVSIPVAERMSSFKRAPGGAGGSGGNRGGGNYGGGGGNRGNYGGGNNYGGNNRQQQSSTFSGGSDGDDILHV